MMIENMQTEEQNPEGMTYLFHPFGVSDPSEIIYFCNHHTPSGLKFNCITPIIISEKNIELILYEYLFQKHKIFLN